MDTHKKPTGRASSMTRGLLTGLLVNLACILAASGVLAKLVDKEMVSWDNIGYGIMAVLLAASCLGAFISCQRIKHRRLLVCCLSSLLDGLMLLCIAALFYGGEYEGVLATLGLVLAGGMTAFLATAPKGKHVHRTKYRSPTR